jgi:hypothetical protein
MTCRLCAKLTVFAAPPAFCVDNRTEIEPIPAEVPSNLISGPSQFVEWLAVEKNCLIPVNLPAAENLIG